MLEFTEESVRASLKVTSVHPTTERVDLTSKPKATAGLRSANLQKMMGCLPRDLMAKLKVSDDGLSISSGGITATVEDLTAGKEGSGDAMFYLRHVDSVLKLSTLFNDIAVIKIFNESLSMDFKTDNTTVTILFFTI